MSMLIIQSPIQALDVYYYLDYGLKNYCCSICVVLVAEVNGGSNLDLVLKSAILDGTFRAFSNASLHKLRQRIEEVIVMQ
ncbi:IAA-amino acid hydrolase ILR1-like 6 [Dendrobium catenatum]|uniref:IAA-amino acid hydrolase ILR1-like 6 n=1 Tax=Dendrobium catenatum TaxID=906689 RepID=UPI00109F7F0A|nr:IAA-amino acid hydrolase ILR1-like 6 [Dendrobium catenatum]